MRAIARIQIAIARLRPIAGPERQAHADLRAHVGRGAGSEAGAGEPRVERAQRLRDAEVGEDGVAGAIEEDVAGLHVPVDDALTVDEVERLRDVGQPAKDLFGGLGPLLEPVVQAPALMYSRTANRAGGASAGRSPSLSSPASNARTT